MIYNDNNKNSNFIWHFINDIKKSIDELFYDYQCSSLLLCWYQYSSFIFTINIDKATGEYRNK
ncbi:hypothetical protein PIROE2DRAFT_17896 [Piromyces sp. E2]|nr:hypothetical protein PIROE2DRAFT_17896 [Piromyces sp. E2]|eukprot:OUM57184.1 hypothetical protein PIROE2DRAFT_17896 [Piromyces sp. E2]